MGVLRCPELTEAGPLAVYRTAGANSFNLSVIQAQSQLAGCSNLTNVNGYLHSCSVVEAMQPL